MFSVWWLRYQTEFVSPYSLPYTASCPLTYKDREFNTESDIWNLIEEINEVNKTTSRSLGQDLFHLVPLFTNPKYIIKEWHYDIINEYHLINNFNISLGVLDDIESKRLDNLTIVHNEINAIMNYESKKNGK